MQKAFICYFLIVISLRIWVRKNRFTVAASLHSLACYTGLWTGSRSHLIVLK